MNDVSAENENGCPKCGTPRAPEGICVNCGLVFAKYRLPVSTRAVSRFPGITGWPDATESGAPQAAYDADSEPVGKVDIVNIIVLLLLVDSTLSLLGRAPALGEVLAGSQTFHQKARHLYDVCAAAGMFVSVIGVLKRKEWARISMIALLALGLAEGIYMWIYMHDAVTVLEKELQENLSYLKRNNSKRWIGCALYAVFIMILNSSKIKARFNRRPSSG